MYPMHCCNQHLLCFQNKSAGGHSHFLVASFPSSSSISLFSLYILEQKKKKKFSFHALIDDKTVFPEEALLV